MTPDRAAELQCSVGIAAGTFPQRLAGTGKDAQALYRALLPPFAATGTPPTLDRVAREAGLGPEEALAALRELADADMIALGPDGVLAGAFPLSAEPTRHRVLVGDGPVLHAMCAVDALGVPAMLGGPGAVTSADPATGQRIEVRVADGRADADPPSTVVLLASRGGGRLASACCSVIDFYADPGGARAALVVPGTTGGVLSMAEAYALGVALFADLPALPARGAT